MRMHFSKEDGDEMIDGVRHGFVAVQRKNSCGEAARIEIWRDDYEGHCGNLPTGEWTAPLINGAITMFVLGEIAGVERGKSEAQGAMRIALGLAG